MIKSYRGRVYPVQAPIAFTFQNSWFNYGGGYEECAYWMDPDGFVNIKGLARNNSGLISVQEMTTLPSDYWPEYSYTFQTIADNNILSRNQVDTSGRISTDASVSYSGSVWISLSGKSYPSAKVKGWTNVSFQNSWGNDVTTSTAPASYIMDSNGYVHLRGHIQGGSNGTTVFTLPDGYRPPWQCMHYSTSYNAGHIFARVDIQTDGQVVIVNGAGPRLALDDIVFPTSALEYTPMQMRSSWRPHNTTREETWCNPSYNVDDFGIIHYAGLINGGTINTLSSYHGGGQTTGGAELIATASNSALGRLDIGTSQNLRPTDLGSAWFSLDGVKHRVKGLPTWRGEL